MEKQRVYVVRSVAPQGTVSYNCPTANWALRKLRDFQASERPKITVTDPDGILLTEADLIGMVENSGTTLSEETIPGAPQVTRRAALA